MKALLFVLVLLFSITTTQAQTKLANGNYSAAIKNDSSSQTKGVITNMVYTHSDGKDYPIYRGVKGGLYALVPNKKGGISKKYMPKS